MIWSVTVINAVIGFVQESRAERSIGVLTQVFCSETEVLRDGRRQRFDARQQVPGDVVLLSARDRVPADLRLLKVRRSAGRAAGGALRDGPCRQFRHHR